MTTVLAFLLTIGVLVTFHEWGHFRAARACGVKVLRFSIGFGRPLLRWTRGETEFVLAALPLGGYVRMLDSREDDADPADLPRAFDRQSLGRRAFIVAAGPLANLVLAAALYAAVQAIGGEEPAPVVGSPPAASLAAAAGLQGGDTVLASGPPGREEAASPVRTLADLRWQLGEAALDGRPLALWVRGADGGLRTVVLPLDTLVVRDLDAALMARIGWSGAHAEARLGAPRAGGPADRAGLREGDLVIAVDGEPVPDAARLRERLRGAAGQNLVLAVQRGGQRLEIEVQPRREVLADGSAVGRIDVAVGSPPALVFHRAGPVEAVLGGLRQTVDVAVLSLRMLGRMVVGQSSLSNLSGPLTVAEVAGRTASAGVVSFLGFLSLVSVSLGVLNLLPLPMLDGGHLVYYILEGCTGRPLSEAWHARLQRGGLALMGLLMSLALYNDMVRLLGLQ